jgi:hypothetical protein
VDHLNKQALKILKQCPSATMQMEPDKVHIFLIDEGLGQPAEAKTAMVSGPALTWAPLLTTQECRLGFPGGGRKDQSGICGSGLLPER